MQKAALAERPSGLAREAPDSGCFERFARRVKKKR